jgi:2-polyprenyl-3-methyl-5-hydroxy-6-metoxy-1,4-benzoquinol methylase
VLKSLLKNVLNVKVPEHLRRNFREADGTVLQRVRSSLERNYFAGKSPEWLSSESGKKDFDDHLFRRLTTDRTHIVPWLDAARPLKGASILEIGCGTGCSTVAMAEQGASVTAVDIDQASLAVATDRCEAYGVSANFLLANAMDVHALLRDRHFDFLIFFAAIEHMTHDERMSAMKSTWEMLREGDLWCVVDTPNRLWYFDHHTSNLPFFHWLPDDLAFKYSRFSQRPTFGDAYRDDNEPNRLHFLRRGRGVSFHEFDLAMRPAREMNVVSSSSQFRRQRSMLRSLAWRLSPDFRYRNFLRRAAPGLHEGFFERGLELIIRKN